MQSSLIVLVLIFLTLSSLIIGVILMARGGNLNKQFSNKLMVMRVVFQALAIAAVFLVFYLTKK